MREIQTSNFACLAVAPRCRGCLRCVVVCAQPPACRAVAPSRRRVIRAGRRPRRKRRVSAAPVRRRVRHDADAVCVVRTAPLHRFQGGPGGFVEISMKSSVFAPNSNVEFGVSDCRVAMTEAWRCRRRMRRAARGRLVAPRRVFSGASGSASCASQGLVGHGRASIVLVVAARGCRVCSEVFSYR